jgi:integrase
MIKMLLKKYEKDHNKTKSAVLEPDQIITWLENAPEEKGGIGLKAAFVCGFYGLLRVDELVKIHFSHVNASGEDFVQITVGQKGTKTDQSGSNPFTFFLTKNVEKPKACPVRILKTYMSQVKVKEGRFFRNWNKKSNGFSTQPTGKNTLAKIPFEIATFLGLENPKTYTGHCFRRSSATSLADSGISKTNLKRTGRWKSDAVAEGYLVNSKKLKIQVSEALTHEINGTNAKVEIPARDGAPSKIVYIQNCQNVALNL